MSNHYSHQRQGGTWQSKTEQTSLPGINEMFPEHFMHYSPNTRYALAKQSHSDPSQMVPHNSTSSPAHTNNHYVASPALASPTMRPPSSQSTRTPVPADKIDSETSDSPGTVRSSTKDVSDKKHACPVCSKRFSRPSSLRIHVNTHTGETPFRCPYPGCGREFNVNSNMRRHYRNHGVPGGIPSASEEEEDGYPSTPGSQSSQKQHQWIQMEPTRQVNSYPMSM